MIKFEEHDGLLFRMLDEPVPLTPDAEMPCLVRLIQDDSPMGKFNKDLHAYDSKRFTQRICTEIIDVNDLSDHNRGSVRYDGFISCQYYHYELIGTSVAEGSKEWALYQISSGKKVVKEGDGELYCGSFYKNRLFYLNGSGCLVTQNAIGLIDPCSEVEFLNLDKAGWQIYKEPEQPKYKVGDWFGQELKEKEKMQINELIIISKKFTDCHEAVSWAIKQPQLRRNGAEIYLHKAKHPAGHMFYHICRSVVPSDHVDIIAIGSTFEKVIYGTKYEYAIKRKILINDEHAVIIPEGGCYAN